MVQVTAFNLVSSSGLVGDVPTNVQFALQDSLNKANNGVWPTLLSVQTLIWSPCYPVANRTELMVREAGCDVHIGRAAGWCAMPV